MRSRNRILPLAAAAIAAVGAGLASTASSASAQKVNAQGEASSNWSGYVVTSKSGQSFSSVSGSWVQPSVNASSSTSQSSSAFWVGIGGYSSQSPALEQVGTEADVVNGQTQYHAWTEVVPSPQQPLDIAINPGDHISAKVTVNGTTVTMSLTDDTSGQTRTKTVQVANPDTSSAEWIAEAPAAATPGGYSIVPLADFGKVTFTGATATAGGHTGTIADSHWNVARVDLGSGSNEYYTALSDQSSAGATTGDVSTDGTSFTVGYSAGNSAAQSPTTSGDPGSGYGYVDPYAYVDPYGYAYPDPGYQYYGYY
jgi:hypothetical protein